MCVLSFVVPSEAVPALLGLAGAKVKDTMRTSRTTIEFSKYSDILDNVTVYGEPGQCDLARRIILHGVSHYLASMVTMVPSSKMDIRTSDREDAECDVRTVLSELEYHRC